jgi:hypothetical protein
MSGNTMATSAQDKSWIYRAAEQYNSFIDSIEQKTSCRSVTVIKLDLKNWGPLRVITTLVLYILLAVIAVPVLIVYDLAKRGVIWVKNAIVGEEADGALSTDGQRKGPPDQSDTTDRKHTPPLSRTSTPGTPSTPPRPPGGAPPSDSLGGSVVVVESNGSE